MTDHKLTGEAISWDSAERQQRFAGWLAEICKPHGLLPDSLSAASADASFRRYFRIDRRGGGSCIIMDAPPERENSEPFVRIAAMMASAGLRAPEILQWDQASGFLLLSDLGQNTMMQAIKPQDPQAAHALYLQALDVLLRWQQASQPETLPPYDAGLLRRELQLFPQWYVGQHRGYVLSPQQQSDLAQVFEQIITRNLAAPQVYVHRDFMPRNLMMPDPPAATGQMLGILDFQDAVYGPLSYDIASLMRDAFLSWDEDFVLDITIRYWERARKLGLMDFEDWSQDFSSFWQAVEWMGLQRHLKVAGIFARLTLRDGKPGYLADTPRFIAYIRHAARRYRDLTPLLKLVDAVEGRPEQAVWVMGRG